MPPNEGKYISEVLWDTEFVNPGQGLSLFLRPVIDKGASLYMQLNPDSSPSRFTGSMEKEAKKKGCSPRVIRHFYELRMSGNIHPRLQIIYDGGVDDMPPGHCTLTVSSRTAVRDLHDWVDKSIGHHMKYIGPARIGWKEHA